MLQVEEIDKIFNFTEHVYLRQCNLFKEYKDQFPNLYRAHVAEFYT